VEELAARSAEVAVGDGARDRGPAVSRVVRVPLAVATWEFPSGRREGGRLPEHGAERGAGSGRFLVFLGFWGAPFFPLLGGCFFGRGGGLFFYGIIPVFFFFFFIFGWGGFFWGWRRGSRLDAADPRRRRRSHRKRAGRAAQSETGRWAVDRNLDAQANRPSLSPPPGDGEGTAARNQGKALLASFAGVR